MLYLIGSYDVHSGSLPTRGAWIEIDVAAVSDGTCVVAPHTGSVD